MLVNINKLKPYRFIEDKTLQHVLVKFGNLVIDKPIQAKELAPLPVELKDFQPIKFEPINIHSTPSSIKVINAFIIIIICLFRTNVMVSND
jgi:hypothetical protein